MALRVSSIYGAVVFFDIARNGSGGSSSMKTVNKRAHSPWLVLMIDVRGARLDLEYRFCRVENTEYGLLTGRVNFEGPRESRMKQRLSFKNLPKIQAKRFKKLRQEKERERAKRMRIPPVKKRSPR